MWEKMPTDQLDAPFIPETAIDVLIDWLRKNEQWARSPDDNEMVAVANLLERDE